MKIALNTETCLNWLFWHNVTPFDAHWRTDIRVDQSVQWTEQSICYSSAEQTCES